MIHTIHLNDEYVGVRELLKEIRRQKQGVRFDGATPDGYMSSEAFRKRAIEKVNNFCNKHGIL